MAEPAENTTLTPAPPGLRMLKKLGTRVAIQDAALELFAEQGFDETTVEQIAARAEVSTTTFFRYFGTKGEVIISGLGYPCTNSSKRSLSVRGPNGEWLPT